MTSSAVLPPAGLPGLRPEWSRLVTAEGRTWHVLDTMPSGTPRATLLCVHGNPTWSYLWRSVLASAPEGIRVVAVDQLGMGWSERPDRPQLLADRVADLGRLTDALGIDGPVITMAHDWGGPVSLGWALEHRVRGVILLNTAVHQPERASAPRVIRLARNRAVRGTVTVGSRAFISGTLALCRPRLAPEVARAYAAPYASADRRRAIGQFVADIPLEEDHPSMPALRGIAEGLDRLAEVPVLLLWGPRDPVFSDLYLRDLQQRLPHAQVHRYEGASHLVIEDAPSLTQDAWAWIAKTLESPPGPSSPSREAAPVAASMGEGLARMAALDPGATALVECDGGRSTSWGDLARRVENLAAGLHRRGVLPGQRVGLLVPPGVDLVACVYACWRLGASVVVVDAGLGLRGMRRAMRSAGPDHAITIARGRAVLAGLRVPQVIGVRELARIEALAGEAPAAPEGDPEALLAFTSGATGPAKGVRYRMSQVAKTRDALAGHYGIDERDALVAAFAPWSVLGPALGIASAIPRMRGTDATTLTATAVAEAVDAVRGTIMWASPAALGGIVSTQGSLGTDQLTALGRLRLVLGAGAPVPRRLLAQVHALLPGADLRTPYGMTEALPVADAAWQEIAAAPQGSGVLVGRPLPGVQIAIRPLDAGDTGEVLVSCAHMRDGYDRLWAQDARSPEGWHATGDVGHLDAERRLWIEGRLAHVVWTAEGPIPPVGIEQRIDDALAEAGVAVQGPGATAIVGVGPRGAQQVVAVLAVGRGPLADEHFARVARGAAGVPLAAVLACRELPVDIRHRSKIDRAALAQWADRVLRGAVKG